jgi:hypothetical protein
MPGQIPFGLGIGKNSKADNLHYLQVEKETMAVRIAVDLHMSMVADFLLDTNTAANAQNITALNCTNTRLPIYGTPTWEFVRNGHQPNKVHVQQSRAPCAEKISFKVDPCFVQFGPAVCDNMSATHSFVVAISCTPICTSAGYTFAAATSRGYSCTTSVACGTV